MSVCLYTATTAVAAAAADDDDVDVDVGQCLPGSFSSTGLESCETCPLGHYQPHYAETSCLPCPPGMTTWRRGTRQLDECRGLRDCLRILGFYLYSVWAQLAPSEKRGQSPSVFFVTIFWHSLHSQSCSCRINLIRS